MRFVRALITFSDRLSKLLMIFAAIWALGLSVLIVADIVANNLVGSAIPGVRELVISSIVMIVYMQLGYAIRSRSMLRADTFLLAMPAPVQRVLLAFGYALGAVFFFLILKGTVGPAMHGWTTNEFWGEGALRVPVWPTRFMVLFGSALAVLNYVVAALIDVIGLDDSGAPVAEADMVPHA